MKNRVSIGGFGAGEEPLRCPRCQKPMFIDAGTIRDTPIWMSCDRGHQFFVNLARRADGKELIVFSDRALGFEDWMKSRNVEVKD